MVAKLIALVVPLGLDTFAMCCALGMAGVPAARRYRISALMVTFEAGMPLAGLAIGVPLGHVLGDAAGYLAAGILAAFGLYMLVGEAHEDEKRSAALLSATGWRAVALGVSVSLDELAVGFTLGLLRLPIVVVIVAIAGQALVVTQLGMWLGTRLRERVRVRERAEQLAGLALFTLACVLLLEKLPG